MIKSRHSEIVLEETDILDWIMQNPKATMPEFLTRGVDIPKQAQDIVDTLPTFKTWSDQHQYTEDFDIQNQQSWYMPEYYQNFDIAKWCLDQCKQDYELQRVGEELLEFQKRGMFPVLCYLKYLIDIMKQNGIIWGVGRGSSVASYVLYLMGVHKVNSLYYDLPLDEFLR